MGFLNNAERNKGEDYTRVLTLSLARIATIKYLCRKCELFFSSIDDVGIHHGSMFSADGIKSA